MFRMFLYTHGLCMYRLLHETGARMARPRNNRLPSELGDIFRWSEAQELGITDARLSRLEHDGLIQKLGHGLYAKPGILAGDLTIVVHKAGERATLCLASALAHHDLIDQIPAVIHVALPRGTYQARTQLPIRWHSFDAATFNIGRIQPSSEDGLTIAVYSPERSICDAYRMRHNEGGLGREALRTWVQKPSSQPSNLLRVAQSFPKAIGAIRRDLEILL
jgi:predicted transcriptional regulator of viral defense system